MRRFITFLFFMQIAFVAVVVAQCDRVPDKSKEHFKYASISDSTVSFTRLIEEMKNDSVEWTIFSNINVKFNSDIDKSSISMDSNYFDHRHPRYRFKCPHIEFFKCHFDVEFWLILYGASFDGHLSFVNCENLKADFKGCNFKGQVRFNGNNLDFVDFDSCWFHQGFKANRTLINEQVLFYKCTISSDTAGTGTGLDMSDKVFQVQNNIGGDLTIDGCTFCDETCSHDAFKNSCDPLRYYVDFSKSRFKNLAISNSTIKGPLFFYKTFVEGQMYLFNSSYNKVVWDGASLNPNNSQIEWDSVSNKIAIWDENGHQLVNGYTPSGLATLDQYKLFARLMSSYAVLYKTYKTQDNKKDTKNCYVEWKNVETSYFGFLYHNRHLSDYCWEYYLNNFFWFLCRYGTNPFRAVWVSFYVIFIFALLYFFSFARMDNILGKEIKYEITSFLGFVRSGNPDYNSYQSTTVISSAEKAEPVKKEKKSLFKQFLEDNYNINLTIYIVRFQKWIYRKVEHKPGEAIKSNWFKRSSYVFFFYSVVSFSFLILLIMRYFDSVIFSINVFTTLGFGELKLKGFAVYLTVIEGFVGWLFLGIFSVSLINQVIT